MDRCVSNATMLLLAVASAAPAGATVSFEPQVLYPVGQMPAAVTVADLDDDGFRDIVVANILGEDVSVLKNLQDGTFAAQVRFEAGAQARTLAVGDLNGDDHPDLAVGLQSGLHALAILFNDGSGAFSDPVGWGGAGRTSRTVLIARLDDDPQPDVAMAWTLGGLGEVAVFLNDGAGGFADPDVYTADPDAFTGALAAADVDADGDTDLIATFAYSSDAPIVFVNTGEGSFAPAVPLDPATMVSPGLAAGDLDGDSVTDIVATTGGIRVYLNDGTGEFGEPSIQTPEVVLSSATRLALGDVDRDGATDLIVPGGLSDRVGVLLNDGSGQFVDESLHETGDYASEAAVADLDGDEWPDLVVSNRDGSSVSVLRNASAGTSTPAGVTTSGAWLASPRPNPARTSATIAFGVTRPGRGRLTVLDVAGRVVNVLTDRELPAGAHRLDWDLRNDAGRPVPSGIYWLRLDVGEAGATRSVAVIR